MKYVKTTYAVLTRTAYNGVYEGAPYDTLDEARVAFETECGVIGSCSREVRLVVQRVVYDSPHDAPVIYERPLAISIVPARLPSRFH